MNTMTYSFAFGFLASAYYINNPGSLVTTFGLLLVLLSVVVEGTNNG